MSREKAIDMLGFASGESDPIEIKKYIGKALSQLRKASDEDPITFLAEVVETIQEHFEVLVANLPEYNHSPIEKAQKYLICESQLITISEFAKEGLKARLKGAGRSAQDLIMALENHNLQEFSDAKVEISVNGERPVHTTVGQMEALTKAIERDPRIIALKREGEEG